MPPYGLYSLANTPEELLSRGYDQDVLYDYDPAFGQLRTVQRYQPAPFTGARPFQKMYDIAPYTDTGTDLGFNADLYSTSFGGVSGYRDVGGNQNQDTNIMQQAPQGIFNDFYGSVYEPYNEEKDDEQVDYLPGQSSFKDKISNIGSSFMQKTGIGGLLGLITGNPILGLIGKGIGALANRAGPALNDFKSASTGAQFFQNLRDRRAREDAAARGAAKANMADARAITNRISKAKVSNQDSYRGGGGGGGGGAPSNTNSGGGTFGTSSNNSSFSDYS